MRIKKHNEIYPKELKETEICKMFYHRVQFLQQYKQFKKPFYIFHIANEQYNPIKYTLHLKQMGLQAGIADYCILKEGGSVFFIEFKRDKKSKLTDKQKEFKTICESLNINYYTCYTVDEGINVIEEELS